MDGRTAVRVELGCKLGLHPNPVWNAEPAAGCCGHSGGLVDDHLDVDSHLAALSLGVNRASALFHLGIACDRFATIHHSAQLGTLGHSRSLLARRSIRYHR